MGQDLKAKEVLLYKPYEDRQYTYTVFDKSKSLAFRSIWMLFYSYIMKCRSSEIIPDKDELYIHINDAISTCIKYHPNSELTKAFRKHGNMK